MINAEIISDSLNKSTGDRLTTFVLDYPRIIHAELLTHRMFSKNSASSRAIPIKKFIEQVTENPYIPSHWGKNQPGMQANEELDPDKKLKAQQVWLKARDAILPFVNELEELGLHKQITNRLMEPWFNIRVILSATNFENFFALRAHTMAHPDLQKLAFLMLEKYNESTPKQLVPGEWHIPFGDNIDSTKLQLEVLDDLNKRPDSYASSTNFMDAGEEMSVKIAVARCARVSYLNFEGKDDYAADVKLCDKLFSTTPKHLSPAEHVAIALSESQQIGNFVGWKQYRKFFPDENLKDIRVIRPI